MSNIIFNLVGVVFVLGHDFYSNLYIYDNSQSIKNIKDNSNEIDKGNKSESEIDLVFQKIKNYSSSLTL